MYVHDDGNDQKHKVYKPHHAFTCTIVQVLSNWYYIYI